MTRNATAPARLVGICVSLKIFLLSPLCSHSSSTSSLKNNGSLAPRSREERRERRRKTRPMPAPRVAVLTAAPPWWLKPRALYFSFFCVLSCGFSRFYSLFLRERDVPDVGVGFVLSASDLSSVLFTPMWTACVDANGGNPAPALIVILVMTPICFACQAIGADAGLVSSSGGLTMFLAACRFSISSFLVPGSTLLDGLAMSAVRTESERAAYGTERLWGAVSWAIETQKRTPPQTARARRCALLPARVWQAPASRRGL